MIPSKPGQCCAVEAEVEGLVSQPTPTQADVSRLAYVGRRPGHAAKAQPELPERWKSILEPVGLPIVQGKADPGYPCIVVCTNATETRWYQALLIKASRHCHVTGRIFKGSTRGSVIFLLSDEQTHIERFEDALVAADQLVLRQVLVPGDEPQGEED
ncbi:MAG: hypothetical protein RI949_257 [Pseudomonadota bacterium]|jgi:hypothetical protein